MLFARANQVLKGSGVETRISARDYASKLPLPMLAPYLDVLFCRKGSQFGDSLFRGLS